MNQDIRFGRQPLETGDVGSQTAKKVHVVCCVKAWTIPGLPVRSRPWANPLESLAFVPSWDIVAVGDPSASWTWPVPPVSVCRVPGGRVPDFGHTRPHNGARPRVSPDGARLGRVSGRGRRRGWCNLCLHFLKLFAVAPGA